MNVNAEMLNERIQQLETLYAELLAEGADSATLGNIWREIRMLRQQLQQLENSIDNNDE